MDIGHCLDERALGKTGRRGSLFLYAFHCAAGHGIALFNRRQGFLFLPVVFLIIFEKGRPSGVHHAPPGDFPTGIGKVDRDFSRFITHGRVELQTERRGNHGIERAFLRLEIVRGQFTRRRDGMVCGDFPRVPGCAFERGVSLSRDLFQTGKRGKRGQYSGGFLILLDRQIAAVRPGIGGQFALIEGLRDVQHFLRRHAKSGGSGFLQG